MRELEDYLYGGEYDDRLVEIGDDLDASSDDFVDE
jgi:hypothetical protein